MNKPDPFSYDVIAALMSAPREKLIKLIENPSDEALTATMDVCKEELNNHD